jgi:hypothetical protein
LAPGIRPQRLTPRRNPVRRSGSLKLPDACVVTSPPHNLGMTYRRYDDRRAKDEYLEWLLHVATEIRRG